MAISLRLEWRWITFALQAQVILLPSQTELYYQRDHQTQVVLL